MDLSKILFALGGVLFIFLLGLALGRLWRTDARVFKRFIVAIVAVIVAIVAFAGIKAKLIVDKMASFPKGPPPEAVTTAKLEAQKWPQSLRAVGSAEPVQGVMLAADLPGVVKAVRFESGSRVKAGDVLVEIDTQQEQAQLRSAEAKRDMMGLSLRRAQDLLRTQANSQSQLDQAQADFRTSDAAVSETQAVISRKTIKAPFDGFAGVRQVNPGQYVNAGAAVVPVTALDRLYVNFSVPQQNLPRLQPGTEVRVTSDATGKDVLTGQITAVNSMVDEATRNVLVQATVANPDIKLRPGVFVSVEVVLPETDEIVAAPASAIAYAPFGDSVYVVEEMKGPDGKSYKGVRQQFVKVGATRGDLIALTSGVKPGEEVVTSGVFKLRPKAAVNVNNSVQPGANPSPTPADT